MLDAVSELTQDGVGDVEGVLRNEVDADPLGSDEPHDLLDLVLEGLRDVFEEQVRLVEEEDEFRLRQIAHFGKLLEELREKPEQESGVDLGRLHQPVGHEDVDDPPALCVGLHEIVDVEGGLAEKLFATLLLDDEQIALDRPDTGLGDVSVLDLELVRVVPHILRHGPEVLEIEKQQPVVVGDLEGDVENAGLGLVQVQDAGEKEGPHLGDRRPDRVPLLAEDIPEGDGIGLVDKPFQFQLLDAFGNLGTVAPRFCKPREIALHVGHEDGHAHCAELLGEHPQGDRFPGAGGAGNQAVPVGHFRVEVNLFRAFGNEDGSGLRGHRSSMGSITGRG